MIPLTRPAAALVAAILLTSCTPQQALTGTTGTSGGATTSATTASPASTVLASTPASDPVTPATTTPTTPVATTTTPAVPSPPAPRPTPSVTTYRGTPTATVQGITVHVPAGWTAFDRSVSPGGFWTEFGNRHAATKAATLLSLSTGPINSVHSVCGTINRKTMKDYHVIREIQSGPPAVLIAGVSSTMCGFVGTLKGKEYDYVISVAQRKAGTKQIVVMQQARFLNKPQSAPAGLQQRVGKEAFGMFEEAVKQAATTL